MLPATIPVGKRRRTALLYGFTCHSLFLLAIGTALLAMYHGMHFGPVKLVAPWNWAWDLLLLAQFPLLHSFLLTRKGGKQLGKLAPDKLGGALSTTTFAIVASTQMLALYGLWSPLGPLWWQSQGTLRIIISIVYLASWLFLGKAMADAGLGIQTGFLGWSSVYRGRKPNYGSMPTGGLFRFCRQPVYLAFALTTWTVPTWSADQLLIALWFTSYCLLGPLLKERRYARRYGQAFSDYKEKVPYIIPHRAS